MSNTPVTAAQVSELRARTGAPLMECKKALQETHGDIEKAIEEMRKAGTTKAAKKEGRITAEGIIAMQASANGKAAALVEINCETDFVARGDELQQFAKQVAQRVLDSKMSNVDALVQQTYEANAAETIEHKRQALVAKIGENITVRRAVYLATEHHVATYLHGNRIGVLVEISGESALGRDMAMQVAASRPEVVLPEQVPAALVEKEREIFRAQAKDSGKPADIIEKMITGRISKFLDEVSLVGQPFVKDPDVKVGAVLKKANSQVLQFVRFEVGEGIEKKVDNFVAEVMAQARG